MSVAHAVEIRCDGVRPDGEVCWVAAGDYSTAGEMRARMTEWGWLTGQRGKDYCPDCRPQVPTLKVEDAKAKDILARLLRKTVEDSSGCWVWTGAVGGAGYPQAAVDGKSRTVHRVVWELSRGPIPVGRDLDHLCHKPRCVNPDHLEPVTRSENILRALRPGYRAARGAMPPTPSG